VNNSVNGKYVPKKATHKAYVRRKYSKFQSMKIVKNKELREMIEEMLLDDQSPKNISGRITKHEHHLPAIGKDSIYDFIGSVYGRKIEIHRKNKKRKRGSKRKKSEKLPLRTFIDERPQCINKRERLGDAEADFIVSGKNGKGILLTMADRKTRNSFIEKITTVTIENVHKSFLKIKERFPEILTITTDNDLLLQKYEELEKLMKVKIYFCHAYHSWEKGTIENTNKYIRREIPKGSDISKYSKKFIKKVEEKLNRRTMECIDHLKPKEALEIERAKQKAPKC
jgi:IS30 family transposase